MTSSFCSSFHDSVKKMTLYSLGSEAFSFVHQEGAPKSFAWEVARVWVCKVLCLLGTDS